MSKKKKDKPLEAIDAMHKILDGTDIPDFEKGRILGTIEGLDRATKAEDQEQPQT